MTERLKCWICLAILEEAIPDWFALRSESKQIGALLEEARANLGISEFLGRQEMPAPCHKDETLADD